MPRQNLEEEVNTRYIDELPDKGLLESIFAGLRNKVGWGIFALGSLGVFGTVPSSAQVSTPTPIVRDGTQILRQNENVFNGSFRQVSEGQGIEGVVLAQATQTPSQTPTVVDPWQQIYLTDSQGNREILDNDNILINYSTGFDKSLIGRIDIYRNGIKQTWLSGVIDLITNAQLKTYAGSPGENSPKSTTSDHENMGDIIQVRIFDKSGTQKINLSTTIKSSITWHPNYAYAHIDTNWVTDLVNTYFYMTDADWTNLFTRFKNAGFNGIQVETNWFLERMNSNTFFASYTINPSVHSYLRTETEDELRKVFQLINSVGLDIELRLQLYVKAENSQDCGRSSIRPSNPDLFFNNLGVLWESLARMAESNGVDILCLLVEPNSLEQYSDKIKALLDRIDPLFSGQFAISESTHHYLAGFNCYNSQTSFEANVGKFWDWKDDQGKPLIIEMNYWPLEQIPLETRKDQRYSVMINNMENIWRKAVDYFRTNYPDHPLVFGEIGTYAAEDGAVLGKFPTGDLAHPLVRDDQEYRDTTATHIIASYNLGLDGICIWSWPPSYFMPGRSDTFKLPSLGLISAILK